MDDGAQTQGSMAAGSAGAATGMPLLAASAAGRLVAAILARANGPQAPAARPLHPRTLWEQVSRRLGYVPPGLTAATFAPLPAAAPPRAEMVWRVRAVRAEPVEEPEVADELPGWMSPTWLVSRPAQSPVPAPPTIAAPAPPLAQLPTLPPATAVQREAEGSPALPVIQRSAAAPSAPPSAAPAPSAPAAGVSAPLAALGTFGVTPAAVPGPSESAFRAPPSLVPAVSLAQQVAYQFGLSGRPEGRGPFAEATPLAPPPADAPDLLRLARPAPLAAEALPAPPASALAQEIAYRFGQDTPPGTPSSFAPPAPTVPSRWSGDLVWRVNPSRAAEPPPADEAGWVVPESPAPFRSLPTLPATPASPATPAVPVAEDRVQVPYLPGPAVPPSAPLVAPPALRLEVPDAPAAPRPPETPAPLWHLGNPAIVADLLRPMIPTTDLLSRLERNIYVEPHPVAAPAPPAFVAPPETPAPESAAGAPAAAMPAPAETPLAASPTQPMAGAGQALPSVIAPPPVGPAPLAMPLTDTRRGPPAPSAADRARNIEDTIAAAEAPPPAVPERGPWGRLVDRVVDALPLPAPVRRALEAATTPSRTEAPATPPATASVTPPVPAAPVTLPVAPPVPAPPVTLPVAPAEPSVAAAVAPSAPLEASAPAPAPLPTLSSAVASVPESPQASPASLAVPAAGENAAPSSAAMQGGSTAPAGAVESISSAPATFAPALPLSEPTSSVSSVPTAGAIPPAPTDSPGTEVTPALITPDATVPAPIQASVPTPATPPVQAAPPARGVGGLFASVINRLLGNAPAPGAPPAAPAGPAPLEMPWVRRPAPGAGGPASIPADLYADGEAAEAPAAGWPAAAPGQPSVPSAPREALPVPETLALPPAVTPAAPATPPAPVAAASTAVPPQAPGGVPVTPPAPASVASAAVLPQPAVGATAPAAVPETLPPSAAPVAEALAALVVPEAARPALSSPPAAQPPVAPAAEPGTAPVAPAHAAAPAAAPPVVGVPTVAAHATEIPATLPGLAMPAPAVSAAQDVETPVSPVPGVSAPPIAPPLVSQADVPVREVPGAPEPVLTPAVPLVTPPVVPGTAVPPARGVGGLFASVINRLLGNAPAPGAPPAAPAGPAPLEMPWVRRPAPGAGGPESHPADLYADGEAAEAPAPGWPATATQGQALAPVISPLAPAAELPPAASARVAPPAELPAGPAPTAASVGVKPITEAGSSVAMSPPAIAQSAPVPTAPPDAVASPLSEAPAPGVPVAQAPIAGTPPPLIPPADLLSGAPGAPGAPADVLRTVPAAQGVPPAPATTSASNMEPPAVPVPGTPAAPVLDVRPTGGEPGVLSEAAPAPAAMPGTIPPVETGAPTMPIAPAAPLVSPAQARGLRGSGGLLGAILNRLLGGPAAPQAPAGGGPPPLAMPWAQRQRPAERAPEFGPAPETDAPEWPGEPATSLQRSVAAPSAPAISAPPALGSVPSASVLGATPSAAAAPGPAPVVGAPLSVAEPSAPVETGMPTLMPEAPALPAVPAVLPAGLAAEMGAPMAGAEPAGLPTVPAVPPGALAAPPPVSAEIAPPIEGGTTSAEPAGVAEPEAAAWLTLGEGAPLTIAAEPWLATGAMAASVARAHAPLVPTAPLGVSAATGLWSRFWSALDRVFRAPAAASERGPVPMDAPEIGAWPEVGGVPSLVRRRVSGYTGAPSIPGSIPIGGTAPGSIPSGVAGMTPGYAALGALGSVPSGAAGMTPGYTALGTPGLAQPVPLGGVLPGVPGYVTASTLSAPAAFPSSASLAGPPSRPASAIRNPGRPLGPAFVMAPALRAYLRSQGAPEALTIPGAEDALPGDDEWAVVPGTSLLSLEAMAPGLLARLGLEAESGEPAPEPEGGELAGTHAQFVAALDRLYGAPPESSERPLAVPYGSFVVPTEQNPYGDLAGLPAELLAGLAPGAGQDAAARGLVPPALSAYLAPPQSATAPSTARWAAPGASARSAPPTGAASWQGASPYAPGGAAPGNSAGGLPFGGPDGSGTDEAAWAAVVASALDHSGELRSPVLALAGREVAPPAPAQAPPDGDTQEPDLDHLADTVYEIIRRRLRDESERTWT